MTYRVIHGDCLIEMKNLAEEGIMVDSIVCDPPYHLKSIVSRFGKTSLDDDNVTGKKGKNRSTALNRLSRGFMGKTWDGGDIANRPETWQLAYNILKPGGFLLAFGGTRTFHRMTCAIEDAGFEIRDCLMWLYGTGFPKSHNISKNIDRKLGVSRNVVGTYNARGFSKVSPTNDGRNQWAAGEVIDKEAYITTPGSPEAAQWDGWGTALKPAWEPIIFARKPLAEKTVAANVLKYGTGGINIDGCRIELDDNDPLQDGVFGREDQNMDPSGAWGFKSVDREAGLGRFPANLIHDGSEEVEEMFPSANSTRVSGNPNNPKHGSKHCASSYGKGDGTESFDYRDSGTASRFFYSAKASGKDRVYTCKECNLSLFKSEFPKHRHDMEDYNHIETHPTCKPISLMRYLVRLVTPPNGVVLDPFSGSGTTLQAAIEEGFYPIGIEMDDTYYNNINYRLDNMKVEEKTPTLYD